MTTTVISTVKNETSVLTYDGGNLLITGTGGVIDTSGSALSFVSTASQPLGQVTIQAGALVFGDENGINFADNESTDSDGNIFLIDGAVEGNNIGLNLTGTGSNAVTVTIGSTGTVSGETSGITVDSPVAYITNNGTVSETSNSSIFGAVYSNSASDVTLTNTGTIEGAGAAVNFFNSTGFDNVTNSGQIVGDVVLAPGASITNSGTIDGAVESGGTVYMINSGTITQGMNLQGSSTVTDTGSILGLVGLGTSGRLVIGLQGSITSNDSVAVTASADCVILNHGLISGSDSGVNLFAGANTVALTNTGTIGGGVDFYYSSYDTITNSGTIVGGVNLGQTDHLYNTGTIHNGLTGAGNDNIENEGTLAGGVNLATNGDDNVANTGKIGGGFVLGEGDTVDTSGTIGGGITGDGNATITNSGIITGGILDSQSLDTIDNLGTISGPVSLTNAAAVTNSGEIHGALNFSGTNILDNTGTIVGAVRFSGSSDSIANDGTIHGAVALATGDTFTNNGTIYGALDLSTSDTVIMGPNAITGGVVAANSDTFDFSGAFGHVTLNSFVASGTAHDVITFSSNEFANYTAVQADMVQAGNDVVITLDASDSIVLTHQTLAHLTTHDFVFT